jgi:hypothetical protein
VTILARGTVRQFRMTHEPYEDMRGHFRCQQLRRD